MDAPTISLIDSNYSRSDTVTCIQHVLVEQNDINLLVLIIMSSFLPWTLHCPRDIQHQES